MPTGASTGTRQVKMTAGLGGEQVLLERMRCVETMGGSYTLEIDIVAPLGEIDLHQYLGEPIAVAVDEDDELARRFHGLLVQSELRHEYDGRYYYRLTAKPFTYFLSFNADMKIFQAKSVPDIIRQILLDTGISDHRFVLSGTYPVRDYCVQYRESDLTFITRLMEEEGIYYYWEHENSRHTMVFGDASSGHMPGSPAAIVFNPHSRDSHFSRKTDGSRMLVRFNETVASGAEAMVTLRAWDFKKPQRALQAQSTEGHGHVGSEREVYDYPGDFLEEGRGATLAERQLAALRRNRKVYEGESHAIGLACGTTVSISKMPMDRLNGSYLITHTEHVVQNQVSTTETGTTGDAAEDEPTHVTFLAIPAATPFRLPLVTPKPMTRGLESAIVSGPNGEEIWTDKYGRVMVRFHWDRSSRPGEKSTCWIRVAQFGGLGDITLPRIGQEVMIDFLHGNPDQPIVVGWVFNEAQMPVYALPANRSRHVFRGRNYPGGESTMHPDAIPIDTGNPGANEFRMEDKAGEEEVFLHSEKDLKIRARNDRTLQTGRDEQQIIGRDRKDEVKRDEDTTIGKDQKLKVVGNQTEVIEAKRDIEVKDADKLKVGMTRTVEVGTDLKIKAGTSITIECGSSKITMNPASIKIEATMITVQATAQLKATGAISNFEATGPNTIKGAIVMIN